MTTRHGLPPNPAPWAEIVPGMGPVTVDDLLTIPDDGYIYEVVNGALVRMAGIGRPARHSSCHRSQGGATRSRSW